MAYIKFWDKIRDNDLYQAFITALNPLMPQPTFWNYLKQQYSETNDLKAVEAIVGRIPAGSLVSRESGFPLIGTPTAGEVRGRMPSFGNMVSFTPDKMREIDALEQFITRNITGNVMGLTPESAQRQLIDLLARRYFALLEVSPLMMIEKMFYELWSNGTATVEAEDNLAKIPFAIDYQVKKYHVSTTWDNASSATALADLDKFFYKIRNDLHFTPDRFSLNLDEMRKILAQTSTKSAITSYITGGMGQTVVAGIPSKDNVNYVLNGQYNIPSLNVIDIPIDILDSDGVSIKRTDAAFKNGRVAATIGTQFGYYMYTMADEQIRPDKEFNYAVSSGNVLLSTRSKRGTVSIDSQVTAIPVLTMRKTMAILVTDDTTTGSALS